MSKPHILVIVGTTRPNRVGRTIADWYMQLTTDRDDLTFELVDLAEVNLPLYNEPKSAMWGGPYAHDHTAAWSQKIAAADGFVFVTGEYNHGVPASLKNAIDYLYHEWNKKPVTFVGYGGLGAARAIEQLISSANELRMVSLRERLSIIEVWNALDEQGAPKAEYVKGDPSAQLDELLWWATLLKGAREQHANPAPKKQIPVLV